MNRRSLGLLGLCMRAGRLVTGEEACLKAIRRGEAKLVLVDEGASDNARNMFEDSCAYYEVALMIAPKDELGYAVGKPGRMAAAVTDEGFAGRIRQLEAQESQDKG